MSAISIYLGLCGRIVPLMVMSLWCGFVTAQVIPDSTLNTTVSRSGDNFTISNGNDVSGVNAGSVQIQSRQIQFTDGSLVLAQNFGNLPGGDIRLQATKAIDLIGTTADAEIRSGVHSETLGIGSSGNISVITPRLTLKQGAGLNNITFAAAPSGNIHIDATAIDLSGFPPFPATNPINPTNINTSTLGTFAKRQVKGLTHLLEH